MSNTPKTNNSKLHFPYNTLIWAAFALIAIFLFKSELGGLISNADKLSIFGVEIEVGEETAKKLEQAAMAYEADIDLLNKKTIEFQRQVSALLRAKKRLEQDIDSCPGIQQNAAILNKEFDKIIKVNNDLKKRSGDLKSNKIIRRTIMMNSLLQ